MRLRKILTRAGMAAATLGLGAGLAVQGVSCADGQAASDTGVAEGPGTAIRPTLPLLDLNAPKDFQTATFAFG